MLSIDLRHATIVVTPETLQATLQILAGSKVGSVDARLSNVIVVPLIAGPDIAAAYVPTEAEIAAVKG